MFPKMTQQNQKKFLVFKIIAFESGSPSSYIVEHDSSRCQSICYQATERFKISLREVYPTARSLLLIENIMKVLS